ncbi:hypothetical protein HFO72_12895, partial [Rhizobium laguerreae]|uniref:hypothetical protein n=1 Tax=Rhizobium laguerreae TaxID=1076926 RepID=UPI001C90E4BE
MAHLDPVLDLHLKISSKTADRIIQDKLFRKRSIESFRTTKDEFTDLVVGDLDSATELAKKLRMIVRLDNESLIPALSAISGDLAPKFYPVLSSLQRFLVAVVGSVAAGCGAEPFRLRSTASR